MPIYAYKCSSCGHAQDVLQKITDAQLTVCTVCGTETFSKQLTAPGFQLKGSGWYATDFKDGSKPAATGSETKPAEPAAKDGKPAESKPAESKPTESKPAESKPADSKPETKSAGATGCGSGGCAACS